jgi:hypothetical protein
MARRYRGRQVAELPAIPRHVPALYEGIDLSGAAPSRLTGGTVVRELKPAFLLTHICNAAAHHWAQSDNYQDDLEEQPQQQAAPPNASDRAQYNH